MKQQFMLMLALLCLTPLAYSQSEYNSTFDSDYSTLKYIPRNYIPPVKVKKITFEDLYPDGSIMEKQIKCYDEIGNMTYALQLNRKMDTIREGKFSYMGKDQITLSEIYKKRKMKSISRLTYDKYNHLTCYVKKNGKNKIKVYAKWNFSDKGKITESMAYKKDTSKVKNRWVYEYNEDGSQSKSTLFNGDGKIKRVWSYQCNPEGEKVEVKEKEVQICKNAHSDDQFYITTNRTVNEKGKVYKTVQKFTNMDRLPIESCTYNEKDSLVYKSVYDKSYDRPISHTGFNKKGKKTYEYTYTYENGKRTSYCFSNRGKLRYKTILKYNSEGLLVEEQHSDSKGEIFRTTKLTYEL
jgi:hypothetical protein